MDETKEACLICTSKGITKATKLFQKKICFFLCCQGLTSQTRCYVNNSSLPSAIYPVSHSDELSNPTLHSFQLSETISSNECGKQYKGFAAFQQNDEPQLFTQAKSNNLAKDPVPPKCSDELLGSGLKTTYWLVK